ncbi:MAG: beta-lactamase family protein [Pigmentiphaga sp.]|nr:beta-lactamase family protein [Pigmentiphaga sp.]
MAYPQGVVDVSMRLATTAKVLASAVFVSGRDAAEAFHNSAPWALHHHQLPQALAPALHYKVDEPARRVTVGVDLDRGLARRLVEVCRATYPDVDTDWQAEEDRLASLGALQRQAIAHGDQGCMILPEAGSPGPAFAPVPVVSALPAAAGQAWPMGDDPAPPADGAVAGEGAIATAVAQAMAREDELHAAIVVLRRGRIVAEAYRPGITADTQLESWSMGKSVMSTLIGLLVGRGVLELDEPVPVPSWRAAGDPRGGITLRHLLQMGSGLRCTGHDQSRSAWAQGLPDHFLPYGTAIDVAEFALERPLEHPPGTVGRYRNCDPLALAWLFKAAVSERLGDDPLTWPQRELFDRIGVRRQTLETDRWGRFIVSGFDYGAARNWARLGLLYLQDGCWMGERVLPEGWVSFATRPAPHWARGNYGAQIWLNRVGEFPLPDDAFYFAGGGGQYVFVVPSADLVVVRMGHSRAYAGAKAAVSHLLSDIVAALR